MNTDILRTITAVGQEIHGDDWQSPLCRDLAAVRPDGRKGHRELDPRVLRRWLAMERRTPGWVPPALLVVLTRAVERKLREAENLRQLSIRLTATG